MKKILVYGITENSGGVESVIMNYYRKLDRTKFQFDILVHKHKVAYEEEIKNLGGNIYYITPRRENYFQYKKELKSFFKQNADNYDAIWVNVCGLSNIDYLKYAKKYGIKTRIIHSHNSKNMGSILTEILHKFNKLFIKKYATDFWSCGELASRYFYSNKIIAGKYHKIINNAVDIDKFKFNNDVRLQCRTELRLNNNFVVGHIGRLHFQKNQEFLIDIFDEIQKLKPNSMLVLVGDGEDKEKLIQKINEKGISDKVIFLGIRKDVELVMQTFDSFVFPSLFEGLPVVLFEAQAAGLKIFAADTISEKSKITSNFEFLSLESSPKYWAEKIVKECDNNYDRMLSNQEMKNSNYNIENQIVEFEKFLEF